MHDKTLTRLRPIAELNVIARREFADALRLLFEAAGPLADALYAERPFSSYVDLLERAEAVVSRLSTEAQIEVVCAHPRIGESAAVLRQTSALSYREQGHAAEARLPTEEVQRLYEELAELNRAYERRFGFRFVVFVNGRPRSEIVEVLRERLHNSAQHELQTGLTAMFLIAHDRLRTLSE